MINEFISINLVHKYITSQEFYQIFYLYYIQIRLLSKNAYIRRRRLPSINIKQ